MATTTSGYLEQYLDSLENLPSELKRNFNRMHDLDTKNKDILVEIDTSSDDYLRKVRDLCPTKRKAEMEKIQRMFKKSKEIADDKVNIAVNTYEMIDKHIRKLDSDLAKFESEMKEKGRISQSETEEEEEEEIPVKKKTKDKKKGSVKESEGKKRKKQKNEPSSSTPSHSHPYPNLPGVPQEVLDMPVDPNEPTYCLCNQVSYGEMIGCDNNDCPIEWFHFGCLDITTKPKGKWYCPRCAPSFKKKR